MPIVGSVGEEAAIMLHVTRQVMALIRQRCFDGCLTNLRCDPCERVQEQSDMYTKGWADRMYLTMPAKEIVGKNWRPSPFWRRGTSGNLDRNQTIKVWY